MAAEQIIFVGFEVTDEIAAAMEECREADRVFFEDPTYLEIAEIEDRKLIGKRLGTGIAGDRLEDTARSVVSLLSRISPGIEIRPDRAELIAGEVEPPAITTEMFEGEGDPDRDR